jgi:hypothetical protein
MDVATELKKEIAHLAIEIGAKKARSKAYELARHLRRITVAAAKLGMTVAARPCRMVSGAGEGWSTFGELSVVVHLLDAPDHIAANLILETSIHGIGFRPEERVGPEWFHRQYSCVHHYSSRADVWVRTALKTAKVVTALADAKWVKEPYTTRYVLAKIA